MITGTQIVTHVVADYFCQSDWMAVNKSRKWIPCLVHVIIYSLVFLLVFQPSWLAMAFIFGTHLILDRYSLVKYIIWVKNFVNPTFSNRPFSDCSITGFYDKNGTAGVYDPDDARPFFITIWLYIIMDNTLHLICNGIALTYLN